MCVFVLFSGILMGGIAHIVVNIMVMVRMTFEEGVSAGGTMMITVFLGSPLVDSVCWQWLLLLRSRIRVLYFSN